MTQPFSPADPAGAAAGSIARRVRLREFQSQLLERMQAARTGAAPDRNLLGVEIDSERWLISLHQAGEIVQPGRIVAMPLTHPWFLGLVNVRGTLVGVTDLAALRGKAPLHVDRDSRIVTFASGVLQQGAILVSRVIGLRKIDDMKVLPATADADQDVWVERSYIDSDGKRWEHVSLARVAEDPRFLHVAQ